MILLLLLLIIELWLLLLVAAVILTWLVSLRRGEVGIDVNAYVYIACAATDVHSTLGRMWFLNIGVVDPIRGWVCWETSLGWMIARLVATSMLMGGGTTLLFFLFPLGLLYLGRLQSFD